MFFLDWFFCLVLMESYGTDFSLVLGCFGVSLSFLRPTCRLSSALQGTTASVVQQCAASQRRRLSVTSRHTVILFVHLGFSWKATKCDLDCDLLTGTKLQTESLFRARANYFEHFWRCWKCLKATARFTDVTVPTSRSDRSSKPIQALHIHVDFLRLTQGAGSQRWPAQAAKFVANTSTRTLTLQGQLVRTACKDSIDYLWLPLCCFGNTFQAAKGCKWSKRFKTSWHERHCLHLFAISRQQDPPCFLSSSRVLMPPEEWNRFMVVLWERVSWKMQQGRRSAVRPKLGSQLKRAPL